MNNIENAANVSTASNQGLFIISVSVQIFFEVFTCNLGVLFQTVNQGMQYIHW